jgi:uncharacterized protein YfaS (alpha-2-macroglobulin family)
MPATNVTIDAQFEPVPTGHYTVTVPAFSNGSISTDKTSYAVGDTVSLNVTTPTHQDNVDCLT